MSREEIEKIYNELGDNKIDELYFYSNLLMSGFNKELAFQNINLLKDLWLKDENNYTISSLSDMLYNVYDDIKDKDMGIREVLIKMYENENYGDD